MDENGKGLIRLVYLDTEKLDKPAHASSCTVVSARLWNFQLGYPKQGRFLRKNQHPRGNGRIMYLKLMANRQI